MKRAVIRLLTVELRCATNDRRFYEGSNLERIVTFFLENSNDLAAESKVVNRTVDSLNLAARLLSYRNKNITYSNSNKEFLIECFEIVVIIKNICLNDDFSFLVKGIIRGLDPEQVETVSFLEYLAITGLHESVPFQYFLNGLTEHVTPDDIPENSRYYDSEGEVCLLIASDLLLLAHLEKLYALTSYNSMV